MFLCVLLSSLVCDLVSAVTNVAMSESNNLMFFMSLTHQRLNANLEARVSAEYLNFKELKTAANKISLHFLIDM